VINKRKIESLAELAGFSWLTTKDYSEELERFAKLVANELSQDIVFALNAHKIDPQVIITHKITDSTRLLAINECIALVEINCK
jgi:hypothetical protein